MSADRHYTMSDDDLIKSARRYIQPIVNCPAFTVHAGGSHHECGACGGSYAQHVVAALVRRRDEVQRMLRLREPLVITEEFPADPDAIVADAARESETLSALLNAGARNGWSRDKTVAAAVAVLDGMMREAAFK